MCESARPGAARSMPGDPPPRGSMLKLLADRRRAGEARCALYSAARTPRRRGSRASGQPRGGARLRSSPRPPRAPPDSGATPRQRRK
ncbi:conserved hypothetical protein [Ricinus communis]|uniref:Uncharacterized protein n=1 Tax=Ricinus communis TaxID=3988 RepID=B9TFF2_RICCO|nr:conserved hypothetical protein [Ricinus communis]